jgi:hypothetical protein
MANIDFIEIYDNSDLQELCNEFVEWFDICSEENFTHYNTPFTDGRNRLDLRSDESVSVPSDLYPVSSRSLPYQIRNAYWDVLNKCCADYVYKFNLGDIRLSSYTFKLHKVKEGQGYHIWHMENIGGLETSQRMLTWMTYLKVPEEGGETEFLNQSKRIEPVVGRTLIWPAYFTHLHRGNPPLKGEKYYITGWFERD